jgi:hypothetical protein
MEASLFLLFAAAPSHCDGVACLQHPGTPIPVAFALSDLAIEPGFA